MKHKHKLLATASSQAHVPCPESIIGRQAGAIKHMLNSFDQFLVHREDNKIQNFRIRLDLCSSVRDEMFRAITWIHIAVRCLLVKVYARLKVPSFPGSTNLQHLSLSGVRIDDGFSKWISSSCKC
ncbi:unnamed protein product, partial [Prunus brigantina]